MPSFKQSRLFWASASANEPNRSSNCGGTTDGVISTSRHIGCVVRIRGISGDLDFEKPDQWTEYTHYHATIDSKKSAIDQVSRPIP
jgi:hypothetical protein